MASLESGFDRDWDPGTRRAYFADVTKSARLLAYHYVQTTEPEEAVRRAVATVLGDPVAVSEGSINAFAPKRYHLAAVKVANALRDELVGPESDAAEPPEPSVVLGTTTNEENGTPDAVQQSGNDFDDVADAWLEKTLSGLVGALDAESSEDARVRLHELADKLKPFAEFTRAIAEQHTTITSGKFEVDKLLGPARAILNLARDPDGAAILMALMAGGKTSQINSKIWSKERRVLWKKEAQDVNQNFSAEDLERMKRGRAQIGADGYPMEWHHIDGTHEGGVKKMTRTDHRLGDNYRKNHPKKKSEDGD